MRSWARALRRDVAMLWLAARHPEVSLAAKVLAAAIAAYALSPIDLIPDFIPVLGLLDDLLIVPLGIWTVLRMIPPELIARLRAEAATLNPTRSTTAAMVIVAIWLAAAAGAVLWWKQR